MSSEIKLGFEVNERRLCSLLPLDEVSHRCLNLFRSHIFHIYILPLFSLLR